MSEERRKRQQEREGIVPNPVQTRKYLLWGGILILFGAIYYAGWHHRNHKYDKFAQCLTARQAIMYGLYWCPHCAEQKEMLGESFHYIRYVECGIKGSNEIAPVCKMADVKLFPSWQFGVEPPKEGILSLEALSNKTGCALP
jgi:hypothetical protein